MKKILAVLTISLFCATLYADGSMYTDAIVKPITKDRMKLLPVPSDYKNYFILQSFEDQTVVVIGDFAASEKTICLIIDKNSVGKIDEVWEYYPDADKFTRVEKPSTRLYTGYPQICRDIIEGKVFKDPSRKNSNSEYTHEMASLPILKTKIAEGRVIVKRGSNGRYVRYTDPDPRDTTMADFYFGIETGLYSLQFRTMYYKSGGTKIEPTVQYSVYCKNSKDPIVKEYVEMLLKMAQDRKM